MDSAKSFVSGNDLMIKFTGDQKSIQDILKKIKGMAPEAEITFATDPKNLESLLTGLTDGVKKGIKRANITDEVKKAFEELRSYATGTFKDVNLTSYFSEIAEGFTDSSKSANQLLDAIRIAKGELDDLASISNRSSFQFMNTNQLRQLVTLARSRRDVQLQYDEAVKEANKQQDKYSLSKGDIKSRIQGRGYPKKMGSETAEKLGISDKYNKADTASQALMQDYAHTAKLLDVMIAKKKEFSDISTTRDAENFLKQSKEIFDVYMRLVGLEDEVAKAFKIPKDERGNLLTSMIEQDGEKVTRRDIANELAAAQDAYTKIRTKTLHNAVQNADQDIANYIKQNSQKQVERSEKAANVSAERADRDIERAQSRKRVSRPKSDASGISQEYEGAADSAEEFEGAAVRAGTAAGNSAENASEEVKQLRKQIEDAEQELQKLQKGTSLKDALSKDKTGTIDSLLGELKQLNDEYIQLDGNIPEEKLKRFGSLYEAISRVDVDKVEQFDDNYYAILEKFDESGDGEFEFPQLTKIVDESAISRQIQVIDELKAKLHNLTSQTGELGSGEGVGGTGKEIGISVDNEKALENIREVQNQLNTLPDEKNIKITLDIPDVKSSDLLNRFKELQDLYSTDAVNEYGLAFNDKTGIASEVVAGKGRSVKTSSIVQGMGGTANSVLHTHPDVTIPAFSTSEIENLYKELESGITRQFVKAGNQIAMLDVSQLSEKNIGAKELKSQISSEMLKATISHQQEMYSRFGLENILPDNYADVLREKIRHSLVDSLNNAGIPADESIGKLENDLVENIVNNIKSRINSKDVYGNGIVTDEISDIIHELVVEPLKKIHLDNDAINELEADIAGNVGDLPGEKTLKSLQLNKNNVQRINQIAMRSALSNLGIEDVSSVFKVMDEKDWLSSMYPQTMQEPIEIKVDTSKAESQIDELTKPRTIKIDTEINDNNETMEKRTETKQVHEVRRKIAGDNGEVVTRTEKGTTETTGTAQTVPAPDTSRIEETASEISKLKSDVQSAAQSVSSAMNDIATSSNTAATAVSSLNDQISRLSEAKNVIDDVTKPITDNKVVDIKAPVNDATQSKESFTEANKGVAGSISSSVSGLQQEANMFDQTAQSAKEAADAKEQFVKANQQVKDSANATATQPQTKEKSEAEKAIEYYKELERNAGKFREYQKKVEEYGRGVLVNDTQRGEYDHLADIYAKAEAAAKKYGSTVEGLRESQEKYKSTLKDIEDAEAKISAQKKQSDDTRIFNTATKKTSDRLSRISTQDQERWASQYQNLKSAIESATTAFENTGAIDDYNSAVDRAFNTFERFSKMPSGKIVDQTFGSLDEAKSYFEGIVNSYKTVQKGLSGSTQIDSNGIAQWSAQVRDAEGNVERLGVTWDSVTGRMVMSSKQMPHQLVGISGLIDGVKNKVKELATYWTARLFDPMDIVRYAKQIIGVVQEYDDALTEMRKVSEESVSSLKSFQVDSFSKANEVGTTALQLQQSTADWLRLGESFTEAQKSAMQSNILLNVSEFQNISDATESLVSMSQAYKELDKSEIIDRLNNVGNNFSISTSDLAESLKKSSGTLKLAGNTIDEAIALTTAGNAILQDPNTVGTGLKMISLRLTGTKAAAEELAAMGEDVDGMITTQSKLRQTIMDATKVESNNFKGFDILDDNGNYKSTFEILRGISEIYKEIQETDEKYGQNNKNLLLETVAGKNRSSVAASIFSDPQLLNDVYEASQQSQGSAQKELDKYLDSITGKMQKLQNTLHEVTNITIDSEGFKVLLDIVNALLSGVSSLIKTFGGLNAIIGGAVGLFLNHKGLGVSKLWKSFKNIGTSVGGQFVETIESGVAKELGKLSKDSMKLTVEGFIGNDEAGWSSLSSQTQSYLRNIDAAEQKNLTLASAMQRVSAASSEQGTSFASVGGKLKKFGSIISGVASALGTMLLATVASMAISAIIEQIVNAVRWKEIAVQKGKEAQQSIEDTKTKFDEQKTFVEEDRDEYLRLRQGVSASTNKNETLSTEDYARYLELNKQMANLFPSLVSGYDSQGNALLSLSSNTDAAKDSLEQLLDTQRRVAEYKISKELPTAVEGAMVTINDAYEALTSAQNNLETNRNLQKVYDAFVGSGAGDFSNLGMPDDFDSFSFSYDTTAIDSQMQSEISSRIVQLYKDAWTEASRSYFDDESIIPEFTDFDLDIDEDTGIGTFRTDLVHAEAIPKELANSFRETFSAKISDEYKDLITDKTAEYQAEIDFQASEIAATWNSLVPSLIGQMSLYDEYNKLGDLKVGEQLQQIISDDISNLDVTKLGEEDKEFFIKNPRAFLRNTFLEPMLNAIKDESGNLNNELAQNFIDILNPKDIETASRYKERVEEYLSGIFEGDQDKIRDFELKFGIGFLVDPNDKSSFKYTIDQEVDDAKEIVEKAQQNIVDAAKSKYDNLNKQTVESRTRLATFGSNLIQAKLYGTGDVDSIQAEYDAEAKKVERLEKARQEAQKAWKESNNTQQILPGFIEQLDAGQLKAFAEMAKAGEFENGLPKTFGKLIAAIDEFISRNPEIEQASDTLSSLFANEEYKDAASNYESVISAANTALDSLRENGELTAEEMLKLQETFPDLTEFTESAVQDKAFSQLSEWITTIRENMKDMSPEGIEQANTYIQHLIESMGELANSSDDVKNLFMDLYAPKDVSLATHEQREGLEQSYESNFATLQAALAERGEEINWNVVATLVAQDKFSGDADQILQAYDGEIITWEITADTKRIERELDHISKQRGREEARLGKTEASGKSLGSSQYDTTIRLDREEVSLQEQAVQNAYKDYRRKVEQHASEQVVQKAADAYAEAQSALYQSQTNLYGDLAKQTEAGVAELKDQIDKTSNDITKYEQEVTNNQKYREKVSENTARELNRLHNEQAESYDTEARFWQDVANFEGTDEEYTNRYGNITRKQAAENANAAKTNAVTSRENADQYTPQQVALDNLKLKYEDYENTIQDINQQISVKQAKGLKANAKDYKNLVNLTKAQISNLKKQNAELKAGGKLTKDQQDLYRQNEASINNLYSTLSDYEKTAKNLLVTDAQNLAQAISSAMSEMTTETGLSTDTMQQIVTGFSELGDAADISSIFYGTADGVKVDMIALKRLAEQQSKIVNQRFAEHMDEITEAMNRATASGDMTGLRNAQNELADLQRQQAQYLATYQEQMEAFTRLSAISFADQTKNEGADYETAQGYMKTGKELFDKGLIGTDDFKARAAYLDPYGRTDWETFEQNYKKAERYFTDDASGVQHFLDDLRAKGLSTYDDLTGWSLNFADTAKAALQMGMSDEFFMDVLTRTKDYGFNLQYVNSMEEAELKANDLKQQLVDAQIEYAELVNMGASEEVLAEKSKQIEQITSDMGLLKEATNNYVEGSQRSFIEGFKNIEGTIDALEGAYKVAMENHDVSGMELIEKEVQRYADQYGLEIEIDAKTGEITIDEASYNAAAEKYGKSFGEAFREHAQKEINKGLEEAEQSGKSGTIISNLAEEGEEYMSIVDKILPGLDQADSTVNSILSQLRNTDAESLSEIVFGDDELAEGQAGAIESAIDGLISELGLAQDDGKTLLKVLMDILGYDYEIDMKTNMDEANAELEAGLHRIKELQAHNVIQLSFDVEQNPTEVTNMAELQNRQQEIRTAKTKVSVDTSEYKTLDALDKQYGRQIRIQAILDDTQAKTTIADLKQMTEEQLAEKFELDLSTEEGRAEVEALKQQIGLMDEGELAINVKIDDTQFTELIETISHTKPDVEVGADTKKGKASVAGFVKDTEKQRPTIQVGSNTTSATNNAQSAVSAIAGMKASINVGVSGLEAVKSNVLSTINSLRNQAPIIIKTVVQRISSGGDPGKAIGTFHAKASGTAYNVLNYKPIKAHAKGTSVSLDNDEYALTNEVGQESIVRNGHWYMLPGGPHFEHLKKGDKYLSPHAVTHVIKSI